MQCINENHGNHLHFILIFIFKAHSIHIFFNELLINQLSIS